MKFPVRIVNGGPTASVLACAAGLALACDSALAMEATRVDDRVTDRAPVGFRYEPPKPADVPPAASEPPESGARRGEEVGTKTIEMAPPKHFGEAGSRWWTIGAGVADNFLDSVDSNLHFAYTYFLAKDIEFTGELAGWHFNQPGDNTFGVSAVMVLRWHFINTGPWTVYADTGVGFLVAADSVPDKGTSFDLMPRAGVGFTRQLTESGTRLQMGLRWHHASNARIFGDASNPARDSAMVYAGIIFPF